jgi:hypothetical protein
MSPRDKRRYYKDMERMEKRTKLNAEQDIFGVLAGRMAMALFPPDTAALKNGPPRRSSDILSMISGVGLVQVTDAKKAAALLVQLEKALVMGRVEVRIKTEGDRKVYSIDNAEGKRLVGWTVAKDVLLVASGDRLDKTIKLITDGGDNVLDQIASSAAKKAFTADEGIVLYYNLSKTAALVRSMPLPAEIKLMASPVISTLQKFTDVTCSAEVNEEGVLGEVAVRLE